MTVPEQHEAVERVLARAVGGERNPYDWLARAVSARAERVLVLACGTGAMVERLSREGRTLVGLDRSRRVLETAATRADASFVHADANYLPFADGAFDAVVTDAGLAVNVNRALMLAEAARVLREGGVFAGLAPSLRPVTRGELRLVAPLTKLLRRFAHLPGSTEFPMRAMLAAVGLQKAEDARARFSFPIAGREDAEHFVAAIRATKDPARAEAVVEHLVELAERRPVAMPLPFRRVVALK